MMNSSDSLMSADDEGVDDVRRGIRFPGAIYITGYMKFIDYPSREGLL